MKIETLLDIIEKEYDSFNPDDPRKKIFLQNVSYKLTESINKEKKEIADLADKINKNTNQISKEIDKIFSTINEVFKKK